MIVKEAVLIHTSITDLQLTIYINPLYPERYINSFKCTIVSHILMIHIFNISIKISFKWIPQDFTDDKSALVLVMSPYT